MRTRINNDDMRHLQNFSEAHKTAVLRQIMSHAPARTVVMEGSNHFEKTLIKLRRDGYALIDLQPQETACTSVWYRRKPALLRNPRGDVAMLLWEAQQDGEATTVFTWKV